MKKPIYMLVLCAGTSLLASCGTILPDKLWHPIEDRNPSSQKPVAKSKPAATPVKSAAGAEKGEAPHNELPPEDGEAVMFGSAPAAPAADVQPAPKESAAAQAPVPVPQKPEQLANPLAMSMPQPGEKPVVLPPVKAKPSDLGVSALGNTFDRPFDAAWESVLEVMLAAPLSVIDKSSGVIVTEWMIQQRAGGGMGLGIFSDGQRVIRYKYAVKLYDRGGSTEVVVIPHTQYTEGRQWLDGKPRIQISEHLMRLINVKMEGK